MLTTSAAVLLGYQLRAIVMSHTSGVSRLMSDIKYDFGLLGTPALVSVMQVKQNTASHARHFSPEVISVCSFQVFVCVCKSEKKSHHSEEFAASSTVTVSDLLQQALSGAGLCNLYLTLVRIIILHLFVQFLGLWPAETGAAPERCRSY